MSKNRTREQQKDAVIIKHKQTVLEARRKHDAGEDLNGAERYIIKNNIGYSPLLED